VTEVPSELEKDGLCVVHFLLSAERACAEMRRETTLDGTNPTRRAEFETYVAESAVKLAVIGTGSVRLSDEIKKRVLTTFHTLMILRENLDRPANTFLPRRVNRPVVSAVPAIAHI
jgi:hypothetical protein